MAAFSSCAELADGRLVAAAALGPLLGQRAGGQRLAGLGLHLHRLQVVEVGRVVDDRRAAGGQVGEGDVGAARRKAGTDRKQDEHNTKPVQSATKMRSLQFVSSVTHRYGLHHVSSICRLLDAFSCSRSSHPGLANPQYLNKQANAFRAAIQHSPYFSALLGDFRRPNSAATRRASREMRP